MIHKLLFNYQVVLASASPRRKDIFDLIGVSALQFPSSLIEVNNNMDNPRKYVMKQSMLKAKDVSCKMDKDCIVVAADTVVYFDNLILEKPLNNLEAAQFLKSLSNNKHTVYTGISVCFKGLCCTDYEKTTVHFDKLTDKMIKNYIATNEPFDKSGAYGIQGFGSQFVKKINGCYFNVMGFPVNKFYHIVCNILKSEES